jgi:hypothetical protein
MTDEQMTAKFRRLASKTLSTRAIDDLERIITNLENESTLTDLVEVLRG